MTVAELINRRNRVLGTGAPLFYDAPVHLVSGSGMWLTDAAGERYLDVYNNVPCVGHAHPRVVEAMSSQAATLNVHSRYLHEGVLDYAERVVDLHRRDRLESLIFTCTGTEALEVAVMTARFETGGRGIICTDSTYHGNSAEIGKFSRLADRLQSGVPLADDVRAIPVPERYRPMVPSAFDGALCSAYLNALRSEIAGFEADGIPFAGIVLCSILANEGLPDIPDGFMAAVADIVHAAGGLVIADEVQAGFGRTGSWWGYDVSGLEPDIVTIGKPMGSGLPLAGVVTSNTLASTFREKSRYFNTFGASPLQAAVGSAVIDVIEDEYLLDRVTDTGEYLIAGVRSLMSSCPAMGDVRGTGLFIGIDWVHPGGTEPDAEGAERIVDRMRERNVLMGKAGARRNVLKIRPPLVCEREHADIFLEAFTDVIANDGGC